MDSKFKRKEGRDALLFALLAVLLFLFCVALVDEIGALQLA